MIQMKIILALHDESLLSLFYDYMTGPNRGCKPNSVSETIRDVRRILIEVGANDDLRIAFDKNIVSVEMKYINIVVVLKPIRSQKLAQ